VFEAAAGLVDAGFRRVIFLNGHGGQTSEIGEVVRRMWTEKQVYSVAIEWWGGVTEISREIYGDRSSGHSGIEETAMVLALEPDLVDADRAARVRRLPRRPGVKARPFPATVILDREETDGDGEPDLDRAKAAEFYRRTVDLMHEYLEEVLSGWSEI
jgi:creatinine amidohydrolase/Fe(II)-dependent formamide hydrolase-like protein